MGRSRSDLSAFPKLARLRAGQELFMVQVGRDPDDWKPLSIVGSGVREIRIRDEAGAFRVIYVAAFASAVYVLHAFQKKTQTTARRELDLAARRYKEAAAMESAT
jgi:phage-related protein